MEYVILFISGLVCSALLVYISKKICMKTGFVAHPCGRKAHDSPTPLGGGIAIYASLFCVIFSGILVVKFVPDFPLIPEWVQNDMPRLIASMKDIFVVFAVSSCMGLLGFIDDMQQCQRI